MSAMTGTVDTSTVQQVEELLIKARAIVTGPDCRIDTLVNSILSLTLEAIRIARSVDQQVGHSELSAHESAGRPPIRALSERTPFVPPSSCTT